MSITRRQTVARVLLVTAFIAALYDVAAQLAYHAAVIDGTACPVWPATAVALVATMRLRYRAIPGILIGLLLADATRRVPTVAVVLVVAANLAEPQVSVALLRRWRVDTRLSTAWSVIGFLAAISAGAVVSAAGAVAGLWVSGVISGPLVVSTATLWWLGNVCGVLCTAPLVLVERARGYASRAEGLLVLGLTVGVGAVVLGEGGAQVYAVFPMLIWAGLRLGPRGAAAVSLVLSALTVAYAARGQGPFAQSTPIASLLTAQGFILVTSLTTMLLAAVTLGRRRAGQRLARSEQANRAMADEQAALFRVAAEAARTPEAEPTLELAAREIERLLEVDLAAVVRYKAADRVLVYGEWGRLGQADMHFKEREIAPGGVADQIRRTSANARHDERGGHLTLPPLRQRVGAPILLEGVPWGAVIVGTSSRVTMPADTEDHLERFAGLISLAVANSRAHATLTAQATTDPLTGLLNHRAFHERLREEVLRARRHGRALSLAVFDVDHFKTVNDSFGHAAGDHVLVEAARRLRSAARRDEPVGRVGGDELAVIMPEVDGIAAHAAADRIRRAMGAGDYTGVGQITVSAGTCDLALGGDAPGLIRLADLALYWAKAQGRDGAFRYTPDVVEQLSTAERAGRLARSQALSGVRALARAIDAKDPATTRHSERVADLAQRLALAAGWSAARAALLHDAALVHDVGKIGVPDAVLFKRGRLTESEIVDVRRHAELGAQIASEVLHDEQAAWIRCHHERHDGDGYPKGLRGADIPEGARLLAIADAWDAMTRARNYSSPVAPDDAWQECVRERGRQFHPAAVSVLGKLRATGELDGFDDGAAEIDVYDGAAR